MFLKKIQKRVTPTLIPACVITIPTRYLGEVFNSVANSPEFEIPKHLKRVKRSNGQFSEFLLMLDRHEAFRTALVPSSNQFENKEEFEKFNRIWPVSWYPHKEPIIDIKYVADMMNSLKNLKTQSICLVADPTTKKRIDFDETSVLHSILTTISQISQQNSNSGTNYLCTGLDMFLIKEPCESCAMGLVHGRIKRVFYLERNTGVFENNYFHQIESFNHRFEVFKVIL